MSPRSDRTHAMREEALRRGMRHRQRMARRLPNWRTRFRRRLLVLLWLVSPLTMIGLALTSGFGGAWFQIGYYLALIAWYPVWGLLRVLTTAAAESAAFALDERELQIRNRLSYHAFCVLAGTNILIMFYLAVKQDGPLIVEHTINLLVASLFLSATTPTALLAWRMPDDDPEDLVPPEDLEETNPAERSTRQSGTNSEGELSA